MAGEELAAMPLTDDDDGPPAEPPPQELGAGS
jgi:hypothetical protein